MGSFANSLHIKCDDALEVVAAIEDAMCEAGYDATEEQPDEEAMWGMPSALRAIHVAESYQGWVAVLDSDMLNSVSLAAALSDRLEAHAIQFMVHDSDSWHYLLFDKGSQIDEFDSSGGQANDWVSGEMSPEVAEEVLGGDPSAIQDRMERKFQETQKKMDAEMPADIRDIQQRMATGTVTPAEMKQFGEWIGSYLQPFENEINEMVSGKLPLPSIPPNSESDFVDLVAKLDPILRRDISRNRVAEVLGKQAVFAEEVLGDFMTLLGIHSTFANLSYRYLEELTETDLRDAKIRMFAHLKFKAATISGS